MKCKTKDFNDRGDIIYEWSWWWWSENTCAFLERPFSSGCKPTWEGGCRSRLFKVDINVPLCNPSTSRQCSRGYSIRTRRLAASISVILSGGGGCSLPIANETSANSFAPQVHVTWSLFWMACLHRMMSITASGVLGKCIDRWSRILFTLTPFEVACHWKRTAATRWISRQGQRQEIDLQALGDDPHLIRLAHWDGMCLCWWWSTN